ncbi:hypothetical protein [Rubrobacter taiwanensis]|uniref:hypothetical protein n=1 Tax=Rubrobacter taiwanensis TaxID=185139 RepID=UPI00140471D4|nr:hypothetical protein [Rubrobacter taiwanensis]
MICNLNQVNLAGCYADRILGIREGELGLAGLAVEVERAEMERVYGVEVREAPQ